MRVRMFKRVAALEAQLAETTAAYQATHDALWARMHEALPESARLRRDLDALTRVYARSRGAYLTDVLAEMDEQIPNLTPTSKESA